MELLDFATASLLSVCSAGKNICQKMHQKEQLNTLPPKRWLKADGSTVSCTEKVKVLEENWQEVKALLQDVLDDAVLMGCTQEQVKSEYKRLIDALECGFQEQKS